MPAGWNVRFCLGPGQTEASACVLKVGVGGDDGSHQDWTTWTTGDPEVVAVPGAFARVDEIWIRGTASPRGRNVFMSIRFGETCVKRMRFDDSEEHEKHKDDRDDSCDC